MALAIGSLFRSLDRFGHPIDLLYKGKPSYKTKLGALVSLCTYLLILINLMGLLSDFVTGDN